MNVTGRGRKIGEEDEIKLRLNRWIRRIAVFGRIRTIGDYRDDVNSTRLVKLRFENTIKFNRCLYYGFVFHN